MKILKPGREQKGFAVEQTCTGAGNGGGGCGAVLLVEEGDIYQTQRSVRDETDYFMTFDCLACGVRTDIEPGRVPAHVQDAARARKRGAS